MKSIELRRPRNRSSAESTAVSTLCAFIVTARQIYTYVRFERYMCDLCMSRFTVEEEARATIHCNVTADRNRQQLTRAGTVWMKLCIQFERASRAGNRGGLIAPSRNVNNSICCHDRRIVSQPASQPASILWVVWLQFSHLPTAWIARAVPLPNRNFATSGQQPNFLGTKGLQKGYLYVCPLTEIC